MLTGKAKKDFENWFLIKKIKEGNNTPYKLLQWLYSDDTITISYISQWLDSIKFKGENLFTQVFDKNFAIRLDFMSFNDIIKQTIEVCNTFYNNTIN